MVNLRLTSALNTLRLHILNMPLLSNVMLSFLKIQERTCRKWVEIFVSKLSAPHSGTGYNDSLRAGWSGNRSPVGVDIFRTRPNRPWGSLNLLNNGYRVIPGGEAAEVWR